MLHDIVEARPVGDHRLFVTFDDGTTGTLDIAHVTRFDGAFAALRDSCVLSTGARGIRTSGLWSGRAGPIFAPTCSMRV